MTRGQAGRVASAALAKAAFLMKRRREKRVVRVVTMPGEDWR
jgi:hypothetical protein